MVENINIIKINRNDPTWGIPHLSKVFVSFLKTEFTTGELMRMSDTDFHIKTIDSKTGKEHINRISLKQCNNYDICDGIITTVYKSFGSLTGEIWKETNSHINFRIKNTQNGKIYFKVLSKSEIKGLKVYYDNPIEE